MYPDIFWIQSAFGLHTVALDASRKKPALNARDLFEAMKLYPHRKERLTICERVAP